MARIQGLLRASLCGLVGFFCVSAVLSLSVVIYRGGGNEPAVRNHLSARSLSENAAALEVADASASPCLRQASLGPDVASTTPLAPCAWAEPSLVELTDCMFLESHPAAAAYPPLSTACQLEPCVLMEARRRASVGEAAAVDTSVILTAYRSSGFVNETLAGILANARGRWELIVVVDGHDNATEASVLDVLRPRLDQDCLSSTRAARSPCPVAAAAPTAADPAASRLVRVRVLVAPTPVFEPAANNVGMRAAAGRYLVLVQDDMFISTVGFNLFLAYPLQIADTVLGVSGRCGHQLWSSPGNGTGYFRNYVGRCRDDVEAPLRMNSQDRRNLFVRDTVSRGPLAYRADYIRELGYLDEEHFSIGDDEHDLHCRAYVQHGWVVGFLGLDFISPKMYGATRRLRRIRPQLEEDCLGERKRRARQTKSFFQSHCALANDSWFHSESRPLCNAAATAGAVDNRWSPCVQFPL